ncbi:MAG: 23S rRNA (adenine(2503)-C(2))-methyltransferase RlmN [Candidatus Omnitrophica bacterium]|nr:23S rRNA (adenine(2503)-C(2))-methyltransferase RlmN [Candidatus Omnitrophota bacterium]
MSSLSSSNKPDIRGLSLVELTKAFTAIGEKPFRAKQIFDWIYKNGAMDFDSMSNISSDLRTKLKENFFLSSPKIVEEHISNDGTKKFLFEMADREKVETVIIPTATRATVCVSTQAGCKFGCKFCASGIGGWTRNLTAAEILSEILYAKSKSNLHPLSHIVFMGTGEPLDNYDNLMQAIRLINAKEGLGIAARRITVSTCGVIPKILQLAKEGLQIELAISLHGYNDESRKVLMPVNKKYPMNDLIAACREYIKATKRQITFEYILIKDVTCSPEAVRELGMLLKGMICKMNLIPYNPVSEFDHKMPTRQEMFDFQDSLERAGIHATIRTPRGRDVGAACGQLRHTAQKSAAV